VERKKGSVHLGGSVRWSVGRGEGIFGAKKRKKSFCGGSLGGTRERQGVFPKEGITDGFRQPLPLSEGRWSLFVPFALTSGPSPGKKATMNQPATIDVPREIW